MTALAVDGNNLIAINCHAHPQLTSSTGEPTGGLYGTVKRLRTLLLHEIDDDIGDVVLVMDSARPSFRYELHPAYKDTEQRRKSKDEDLYQCYRQQCDSIAKLVLPLGVVVAEAVEYEADDGLAPVRRQGLVATGSTSALQRVSTDKP
jgi:DNA polymerase-1